MMSLAANLRGHTITRPQVLKAMADFDVAYPDSNSYKNWLEDKTHKYAVEYEGRLYPPKHIIRQALAPITIEFSGGDEANGVFQNLGFTIVPK